MLDLIIIFHFPRSHFQFLSLYSLSSFTSTAGTDQTPGRSDDDDDQQHQQQQQSSITQTKHTVPILWLAAAVGTNEMTDTEETQENEPNNNETGGLVEENDDDEEEEADPDVIDDQDQHILDDRVYLAEAKRVFEEQRTAPADARAIPAAFDEQDRTRTPRAAQNERSSTSAGRACTTRIWQAIRIFYQHHAEVIQESHGLRHVEEVHAHAHSAIESFVSEVPPPNTIHHNGDTLSYLSETERMEIEVAALLHDVDDTKYFPLQEQHCDESNTIDEKPMLRLLYPNAVQLMHEARIPATSYHPILGMIDLVSCRKNGNHVPAWIITTGAYQVLIPRWSDRIEAVGARGVVRCYQYNHEHQFPLCTPGLSPRPTTVEELWTKYATPERFAQYIRRGTTKKDKDNINLDNLDSEIPIDNSMIGHYYEKLLHVACPPKQSIRNEYLEDKLQNSAKELIEVCMRYGKTGRVDEDYICSLIP